MSESERDTLLRLLERELKLAPNHVIADIGCGPGISSEPFLRFGSKVYGIEPNDPMRQAAQRLLADFPKFHAFKGTAEATTKLAEQAGAEIAGLGFVVELDFLKGRDKLKDYDVFSLLRYDK